MGDNRRYEALAKKTMDESEEGMRHADELIERILRLEGVANRQRLGSVEYLAHPARE